MQLMRNNPKITRIQLKFKNDTESALAGIVSAEPDYKLSLAINRKLGISLKNNSPVIPADEPGSDHSFSRFSYTNPSDGSTCELVSNRVGKSFLLKKLKNIDYIFHIHSPENDAGREKILSLLRETEYVTAVFNIDSNTLNDKNLQYIIH